MALTDRVQAILLRPRQEWQAIDVEQTSVGDLYRGYVAPLAAIGPVAAAIGSVVFGATVPFIGTVVRPSPASAIVNAVVSWALALVGVYVLALIIDQLAPNFGGTRGQVQAFKVAAYSSTAQWAAGVFQILPGLSFLTILGVYSLYLLYLGLPVLMKVPQERALTYTIACVVVAIVVALVIGVIAGSLTAAFAF